MAKNKRVLVMRVLECTVKGVNGLDRGAVIETSIDGGREWRVGKFYPDSVIELDNGAGLLLRQVLELCQQGYKLLPYDLPAVLREYFPY